MRDAAPKLDLRASISSCLAVAALFAVVPPVLAEVEFSGLSEELESNVRILSPLANAACDAARWRVDRLYRDADKDIATALQALGYYTPRIEKSLSWSEECWRAEITIDVGDPVRLASVDIEVVGEASADKTFNDRVIGDRPATGDVLHHGRYKTYKSSLYNAAMHAGYFDAEYERSAVVVDRTARTADLDIRFLSGPKFKFGDLSFSDGILRQDLLRGYTDIQEGDPYSAKAINDLYAALSGSSYFSSVSIDTEPLDAEAKTVPVTVNLLPAKRRIYSIGAGVTTDTGPHGRIGYADRRMNNRGHQFESKLFGSSVRSELNASYRWPRSDPRREWFSVVAGYQHENTDTSKFDTYKVGLSRSNNFGRAWLETRYVDYLYESFVIGDQDSDSTLVILGMNIETSKGRDLNRVLKGYRFSVDLRGASDSVGSDTSFLQLRTGAKWIHSLTPKTRVLVRTHLGFTAKDELEELPASVRFFAGGDRSVRGYDFETLGPVDADGNVIGASNLFDASLEMDYLFRDKWSVAAFVDTGSAFNGTNVELSTGVGIGIRWLSPVGAIRLDFAHPLDDPSDNFRIHFSLGPDI